MTPAPHPQSSTVRIAIAILSADEVAEQAAQLGALLYACVHAGASVGFVLPYATEDAEAFWTRKVLPAVQGGGRAVLVARTAGTIVGSVQLGYDTMPNQPHRAEVMKLLVHPEFRRQGVARALMAELERLARRLERSLLTLDTRTGDVAEPLYTSLGYRTVGVIPGYCLDPVEPRLDATTIMYKVL